MIVSLVVIGIIIVLIYKMVRKKSKTQNKDAQIQDIPMDDRTKKNNDNKFTQSNDLKGGIGIVNVRQDDAEDEELYWEPGAKRQDGKELITIKGQQSDLEGVSEHFQGAYNEKTVKQHNAELQIHENVDNEENRSKTDYI